MSGQRAPRATAIMWVFVAALLLGLAAGFLLGTFMPDVLFDEAFRRDFFTSAGFAGLAALIAAIVAYAAARHTAASAREQAQADRALAERRDRKSQWWSRAEWALTQVASGDAYAAVIGMGVLEALGESEWAGEHEADIVAAATEYALEAVEVAPDQGVASAENLATDASTPTGEGGTMGSGGNHG